MPVFNDIVNQILIGHKCKQLYRDSDTLVYKVEDIKITLHYNKCSHKLQSATIRPLTGKGEAQ